MAIKSMRQSGRTGGRTVASTIGNKLNRNSKTTAARRLLIDGSRNLTVAGGRSASLVHNSTSNASSYIELQDLAALKAQQQFPADECGIGGDATAAAASLSRNKKRSQTLAGNAAGFGGRPPVDYYPVSLQAFLWQLILPFIRPHDRSHQEESATTFEKVLVQNIHHGVSPQLSETLHLLPRWRIILASLPHVLFCCSSYLESRNTPQAAQKQQQTANTGISEPFDQIASKLFYTLHWILIDAASECYEATHNLLLKSASSEMLNNDERQLLLPISIIQNFVYLLAPLVGQLAEKDFKSYRLESGLKIWRPLWQFRVPQVRCFIRPTKTSNTSFLTHYESNLKPTEHTAFGDIYLGCDDEDNEGNNAPPLPTATASQNKQYEAPTSTNVTKKYTTTTTTTTTSVAAPSQQKKQQNQNITVTTKATISPPSGIPPALPLTPMLVKKKAKSDDDDDAAVMMLDVVVVSPTTAVTTKSSNSKQKTYSMVSTVNGSSTATPLALTSPENKFFVEQYESEKEQAKTTNAAHHSDSAEDFITAENAGWAYQRESAPFARMSDIASSVSPTTTTNRSPPTLTIAKTNGENVGSEATSKQIFSSSMLETVCERCNTKILHDNSTSSMIARRPIRCKCGGYLLKPRPMSSTFGGAEASQSSSISTTLSKTTTFPSTSQMRPRAVNAAKHQPAAAGPVKQLSASSLHKSTNINAPTNSQQQNALADIPVVSTSSPPHPQQPKHYRKLLPRKPTAVTSPSTSSLLSPTPGNGTLPATVPAASSSIIVSSRPPLKPEVVLATYFDVAVLKCLFAPSWSEEGIYWGLRYLYNRLVQVRHYKRAAHDIDEATLYKRSRSKSMPAQLPSSTDPWHLFRSSHTNATPPSNKTAPPIVDGTRSPLSNSSFRRRFAGGGAGLTDISMTPSSLDGQHHPPSSPAVSETYRNKRSRTIESSTNPPTSSQHQLTHTANASRPSSSSSFTQRNSLETSHNHREQQQSSTTAGTNSDNPAASTQSSSLTRLLSSRSATTAGHSNFFNLTVDIAMMPPSTSQATTATNTSATLSSTPALAIVGRSASTTATAFTKRKTSPNLNVGPKIRITLDEDNTTTATTTAQSPSPVINDVANDVGISNDHGPLMSPLYEHGSQSRQQHHLSAHRIGSNTPSVHSFTTNAQLQLLDYIARRQSDDNIVYQMESLNNSLTQHVHTVNGCKHLVNETTGELNYLACMRAILHVLNRMHHCSQRICAVSIELCHTVLDFYNLQYELDDDGNDCCLVDDDNGGDYDDYQAGNYKWRNLQRQRDNFYRAPWTGAHDVHNNNFSSFHHRKQQRSFSSASLASSTAGGDVAHHQRNNNNFRSIQNHYFFMHRALATIAVKVFSQIGCPHGCGKSTFHQSAAATTSSIALPVSERNRRLALRAHEAFRRIRGLDLLPIRCRRDAAAAAVDNNNATRRDSFFAAAADQSNSPQKSASRPNSPNVGRANKRYAKNLNNSPVSLASQTSIRFMRYIVLRWPVGDLMDFMHCFYGSCQRSSASLAPGAIVEEEDDENEAETTKDNNVDSKHRKQPRFIKANQAWLAAGCLTNFLNRLVGEEKHLEKPEMFSVLVDARNIVNHLRESEPNEFKRQLLKSVSSCWQEYADIDRRQKARVQQGLLHGDGYLNGNGSKSQFFSRGSIISHRRRRNSGNNSRKSSVRSTLSRKRSQLSRYSSINELAADEPPSETYGGDISPKLGGKTSGGTTRRKPHFKLSKMLMGNQTSGTFVSSLNDSPSTAIKFDSNAVGGRSALQSSANRHFRSPAAGLPTIESETTFENSQTSAGGSITGGGAGTARGGSPHGSSATASGGQPTPPDLSREPSRDSVFVTGGTYGGGGRKPALFVQQQAAGGGGGKPPVARRKSRMSFKMAGQIASMGFLGRSSGGSQGRKNTSQSLRETLEKSPLVMDALAAAASSRRKSLLPTARNNHHMTRGIDDGGDRYSLLSSRRGSLTYAVQRFSRETLILSMKRVAFTMNVCQPGVLPDASVLGAIIEMQAPPVAKVLFVLECANFVHKCNLGKWPDWMVHSSAGSTQQSVSAQSSRLGLTTNTTSAISTNAGLTSASATQGGAGVRKATILHKTAGRFFYEWALSLNVKLKQMLDSELEPQLNATVEQIARIICPTAAIAAANTTTTNFNSTDSSAVANAGVNIQNDDWFSASRDNPYVIRFVIMQLLMEITIFMRESFRALPKKGTVGVGAGGKLPAGPGGGRSKSIGRQRRWSVYHTPSGGTSQKQSYEAYISNQDLYPTFGGRSSNVESRRMSLTRRQSVENDDAGGGSVSSRRTSSASNYANEQAIFKTADAPQQQVASGDRKGILVKSTTTTSKTAKALPVEIEAVSKSSPTKIINQPSAKQHQPRLSRKRSLRFRAAAHTQPRSATAEGGESERFYQKRASDTDTKTDELSDDERHSSSTAAISAAATSSSSSQHPSLTRVDSTTITTPTMVGSKELKKPSTAHDVLASGGQPQHAQQQQQQELRELSEFSTNLPWLDTCIAMYTQLVYICPHLRKCIDKCHLKSQNDCWRLDHTVRKLYGDLPETWLDFDFPGTDRDDSDLLGGGGGSEYNANDELIGEGGGGIAAGSISGVGLVAFSSAHPHDNILSNVNKMLRRKRRAPSIPAPHHILPPPAVVLQGATSNMSLLRLDQQQQTQQQVGAEAIVVLSGDGGGVVTVGQSQPGIGAASSSVANSTGQQAASAFQYPLRRTFNSEVAKYLFLQVRSLFAAPMATLVRGSLVLDNERLEMAFPFAWEFLLLQQDEETVCNSGVFCIVAAAKIGPFVTHFIREYFRDQSGDVRMNSVLRFAQLWRMRFHVLNRLEEGAAAALKLTPGLIYFQLPSPGIGREMPDLPDAPWLPQRLTKLEEVAISTEEQEKSASSFVSATSTRRKKLQESMKQVMRAEHDRHQREREGLRVHAIPAGKLCCRESTAYSSAGGGGNERDASEREQDEYDKVGYQAVPTIQLATQYAFPVSLLSCIPNLIEMLDDAETNLDGSEVGDTAKNVIWECILDDPLLFFRHCFENLWNISHRACWLHALHKLLNHMPMLPAKASYVLFNHLLGFVAALHTQTTPYPPNQPPEREAVTSVFSLLWQIIPSVDCMSFKDLKAGLRRFQMQEAQMLVTSAMPPVRNIRIYCPDLSTVYANFPANEDTQFGELHRGAIDFFDVSSHEAYLHHLVDAKTRQVMLHPNVYVKDLYGFKTRDGFEQLLLIKMLPSEAYARYQMQAYYDSFSGSSKVLLIHGIVKSAAKSILTQLRQQQQMLIIQDELGRLPTFPRKAIEIDMRLIQRGQLSEETYSTELTYKYCWLKLIARLFACLEKSGNELQMKSHEAQIFLDVVNGSLLLHAEDPVILRFCLVTYINVARQIKHIFLSNGYMLIMPSILLVYARLEYNELVQEAIEFAFALMYLLHRNPFLLQTLSSAALLLHQQQQQQQMPGEILTSATTLNHHEQDSSNFQPQHLVKLLTSLTRLPATLEKLKAKNKASVVRSTRAAATFHGGGGGGGGGGGTSRNTQPDTGTATGIGALLPAPLITAAGAGGTISTTTFPPQLGGADMPAAHMREKSRRALRGQPLDIHLSDVVHLIDNISEGFAGSAIPADFLANVEQQVTADPTSYTRESVLMSAISACIAVIASDEAGSSRGHQMLTVMSVLMREAHAFIMLTSHSTSSGAGGEILNRPPSNAKEAKEQLIRIQSFAGCIRSLINKSTDLGRHYTGSNLASALAGRIGGGSPAHIPNVVESAPDGAGIEKSGAEGLEISGVFDDETTTMIPSNMMKRTQFKILPSSHSQFPKTDAVGGGVGGETILAVVAENAANAAAAAEAEQLNAAVLSVSDYCLPRSDLLSLVADFYTASAVALKRLSRLLPEVAQSAPGGTATTAAAGSAPVGGAKQLPAMLLTELNEPKTIVKLTDVAHTLLKVATVEIDALYCEGLCKFVVELLPELDFTASETMKNTLNGFLRRFEKTLNKIVKKPALRRDLDWTALTRLVRGLSRVLARNPSVCHTATIKSIVQCCLLLVVGANESHHGFKYAPMQNLKTDFPVSSLAFSFVTQEQLAVILQANSGFWTLESACAITDKPYRLLTHILLPLCLHFGKQGSYLPPMLIKDMHFLVKLVLGVLQPTGLGGNLGGINSNSGGLNVPSAIMGGGSQLGVPLFNTRPSSSVAMQQASAAFSATQVPAKHGRSSSIMSGGGDTAASVSSIAGFYTRGGLSTTAAAGGIGASELSQALQENNNSPNIATAVTSPPARGERSSLTALQGGMSPRQLQQRILELGDHIGFLGLKCLALAYQHRLIIEYPRILRCLKAKVATQSSAQHATVSNNNNNNNNIATSSTTSPLLFWDYLAFVARVRGPYFLFLVPHIRRWMKDSIDSLTLRRNEPGVELTLDLIAVVKRKLNDENEGQWPDRSYGTNYELLRQQLEDTVTEVAVLAQALTIQSSGVALTDSSSRSPSFVQDEHSHSSAVPLPHTNMGSIVGTTSRNRMDSSTGSVMGGMLGGLAEKVGLRTAASSKQRVSVTSGDDTPSSSGITTAAQTDRRESSSNPTAPLTTNTFFSSVLTPANFIASPVAGASRITANKSITPIPATIIASRADSLLQRQVSSPLQNSTGFAAAASELIAHQGVTPHTRERGKTASFRSPPSEEIELTATTKLHRKTAFHQQHSAISSTTSSGPHHVPLAVRAIPPPQPSVTFTGVTPEAARRRKSEQEESPTRTTSLQENASNNVVVVAGYRPYSTASHETTSQSLARILRPNSNSVGGISSGTAFQNAMRLPQQQPSTRSSSSRPTIIGSTSTTSTAQPFFHHQVPPRSSATSLPLMMSRYPPPRNVYNEEEEEQLRHSTDDDDDDDDDARAPGSAEDKDGPVHMV